MECIASWKHSTQQNQVFTILLFSAAGVEPRAGPRSKGAWLGAGLEEMGVESRGRGAGSAGRRVGLESDRERRYKCLVGKKNVKDGSKTTR